ncbi:MAG TPA: S-methyl-5-thioribose-1-phosphate isomerase [Mariprofundaceae bacterium]|nr:S-methyl-5-thioribose-1-phosphate isomerase [Mariprofundaceae bacterium]
MRVNGKDYWAVNWQLDAGGVEWIDQQRLPYEFIQRISQNPEDVAVAIETMQVRGAPTIGAAAAYGLALAWSVDRARYIGHWLPRFRSTRPTAVNLFHACNRMQAFAESEPNKTQMVEFATAYAQSEVNANQRMGEHLAGLLAIGQRRILTHCNAGWLAAVDWGTATSGIYQLARAGESPFVWVDETRPRLQGARLTAWELGQEGINCMLQVDSAAAWRMAMGQVDAIVVGADRIAKNGDIANKIGTYSLSLAAKEHGVPMYVAAPSSTFDAGISSGDEIPIEERKAKEVQWADGVDIDGQIHLIRITAPGIPASNPAFDVTPYGNVTGIVSEKGMWQPQYA